MKILDLSKFRKTILVLSATAFVLSSSAILMGLYEIGTLFLQAIFLAVAVFAVCLGRLDGRLKVLINILFGVFLVGMAYTLMCIGLIISAQRDNDFLDDDTTVIVLGAQVLDSGPSLSYKQRLDTAYEYLIEYPEAKCIVTGGQGTNEPMPEGKAGKEYLVEKGIDEERIFEENKSTSTYENLKFSLDIIKENNLSMEILISTQGFHQYRAGLQARDLGYRPFSLVAPTSITLIPSFYAREVLALTHYFIIGRNVA